MGTLNAKLIGQYSRIHQSSRYGTSASEFAAQIQACILDLQPATILEYGCGQSMLYQEVVLPSGDFRRYDPAIPAFSKLPAGPADLVINTDVLEHIPESDLPDVLSEIRSISDRVFFNIATRLAAQILPDGSNAHCTIKSGRQWVETIGRFFPETVMAYEQTGYSCVILTWQSPVLGIVAEMERLKEVDRRYHEITEPFQTKVMRKFASAGRKIKRLVR